MNDTYKLDADLNPVSCDPMDPDYLAMMKPGNRSRSLAWTKLADGRTVSTVFLGIDHSFRSGPPVLWETMVFGNSDDSRQTRYRSAEAALRGH